MTTTLRATLPLTSPEDSTINATTGVISGTPTTENSASTTVTITVTDTSSNEREVTLTLPAVEADSSSTPVTPDPVTTPPVDTTDPTVEISGVPAVSSGPFTATITFSEAVTGFTESDISISSNARLSAFRETVTGTTYTVVVTPTETGTVTLDIPAGVATDEAGNDNRAASSSLFSLHRP